MGGIAIHREGSVAAVAPLARAHHRRRADERPAVSRRCERQSRSRGQSARHHAHRMGRGAGPTVRIVPGRDRIARQHRPGDRGRQRQRNLSHWAARRKRARCRQRSAARARARGRLRHRQWRAAAGVALGAARERGRRAGLARPADPRSRTARDRAGRRRFCSGRRRGSLDLPAEPDRRAAGRSCLHARRRGVARDHPVRAHRRHDLARGLRDRRGLHVALWRRRVWTLAPGWHVLRGDLSHRPGAWRQPRRCEPCRRQRDRSRRARLAAAEPAARASDGRL